jgi:hypothetical protein
MKPRSGATRRRPRRRSSLYVPSVTYSVRRRVALGISHGQTDVGESLRRRGLGPKGRRVRRMSFWALLSRSSGPTAIRLRCSTPAVFRGPVAPGPEDIRQRQSTTRRFPELALSMLASGSSPGSKPPRAASGGEAWRAASYWAGSSRAEGGLPDSAPRGRSPGERDQADTTVVWGAPNGRPVP